MARRQFQAVRPFVLSAMVLPTVAEGVARFLVAPFVLPALMLPLVAQAAPAPAQAAAGVLEFEAPLFPIIDFEMPL